MKPIPLFVWGLYPCTKILLAREVEVGGRDEAEAIPPSWQIRRATGVLPWPYPLARAHMHRLEAGSIVRYAATTITGNVGKGDSFEEEVAPIARE
jgi:hypothetical protein